MKLRFLEIIAFVLILQSCATLDKTSVPNSVPIITDSIEVNGQYSNWSSDSTSILWNSFKIYNKQHKNYKELHVEIEFVSDKRLYIKLFDQEGNVIGEKKLKGKIEENSFYGRRKFFIIPFFPIYSEYENYRYRISFIHDSMIIDTSRDYWGFATFAGGSGSTKRRSTFRRIVVE